MYRTVLYLIVDTYHKLRRHTASAFLDAEKAFDRVWHQGLIYRYKIFNYYNLPNITKKLLANFIINRKFNIIHGDKNSREFISQAGVPQGSALSPTLYMMYRNVAPNQRDHKTIILQYTDGITILTHNITKQNVRTIIQQELLQLDNYQTQWKIKTNKINLI